MKKRIISLMALTLALALLLSGCGLGKAQAWQASYDLGNRYLSQGNYEAAILAFTAAIEIDPRRVEAYVSRAGAYTAVGDYSAARADYEQAAALAPENEAVQAGLAELDALESAAPQSTPTPTAAPTATPEPAPTQESAIGLADPELPLVYDAYYETAESEAYGTLRYRLPYINLTGADAVNQDIRQRYYSSAQTMLGQNSSIGETAPPSSIDYIWVQSGNLLSLLIESNLVMNSGRFFTAYNLDVTTGRQLGNAEFLAALGVDTETFYTGVREVLESEADWSAPEDLEWTLAEDNIRSVQPYLDEAGNLCFTATVYYSIGIGQWQYSYIWR